MRAQSRLAATSMRPAGGGGSVEPPVLIEKIWSNFKASANPSSGVSGINLDTYAGYGVAANDVLLVFGGIGGGGSNVSVSSSGLTFTQIAFSDGTSHGFKAWYAVIPDDTGRVVTVSTNTERFLGAGAVILRNVDPASVLDVAGAAAQFGSTTTPTVPEVTTVTPGAWAFAAITLLDNYSPGCPVGWQADGALNTSDWSALAVAHKPMAAAGASGDAVFSCSPAINGHRISFAVKPAA